MFGLISSLFCIIIEVKLEDFWHALIVCSFNTYIYTDNVCLTNIFNGEYILLECWVYYRADFPHTNHKMEGNI